MAVAEPSRTRRLWLKLLVGLVLLAALVIGACFWLSSCITRAVREAIAEVTDPRRYASVLASLSQDGEGVAHFPRAIPANARNVRMFYQPPFLQRGAMLQLRYQAPREEIELLLRRRDVTTAPTTAPIPVPLRNAQNTGWEDGEFFGRQFRNFVFRAQPRSKEPDPWNHGIMYGLAISQSLGEVIFWYEEW